MENLTELQKKFIYENVGQMKFTDIAAKAGCSLEEVRRYAPIAFADRQEKQREKYAREQAEAQAQRCAREQAEDAEISALLRAGDREGAYEAWRRYNYERVCEQYLEDQQDAIRDEINRRQEDALYELREAVEASFLEDSEELSDLLEEEWSEYLQPTLDLV